MHCYVYPCFEKKLYPGQVWSTCVCELDFSHSLALRICSCQSKANSRWHVENVRNSHVNPSLQGTLMQYCRLVGHGSWEHATKKNLLAVTTSVAYRSGLDGMTVVDLHWGCTHVGLNAHHWIIMAHTWHCAWGRPDIQSVIWTALYVLLTLPNCV